MDSHAPKKLARARATEALKTLQQYKIQGLLAVAEDFLLRDVLNFNDLLQAGVI
jgi:hypothetical protein